MCVHRLVMISCRIETNTLPFTAALLHVHVLLIRPSQCDFGCSFSSIILSEVLKCDRASFGLAEDMTPKDVY